MRGTANRKNTYSKIWFDDEIIGIEPNGDIHLAPGVHRKNYGDWINPYRLESHINLLELKVRSLNNRAEELGIGNLNIQIHE